MNGRPHGGHEGPVTAGASSATVNGQAYVEADADPVAGAATTVTSAQYGGNLLGAGTVTVSVPGPQTALIGSSIILSVQALTTSSDNKPPTISVTGLPDGLTLAGNMITGTLAADARSGTATVTATDVYGQVGTATISFTLIPAAPVLSHGKAIATSPTREKVTWQQTIPSWERFVIVGPGAINGHIGWVPRGTQVAYYSGLEAHHGYRYLLAVHRQERHPDPVCPSPARSTSSASFRGHQASDLR